MMGSCKKLDAFFAKCRFEYFGIFGAFILGTCTLIAGLGFTGLRGEPYSILNHYISELGTVTSQLAWVFNMGLLVCVPAILLFLVGTRLILHSRLARIGRGFGVMTGIAGFFVGVFPGNLENFIPHTIAASIFFLGGGLVVGFLSIALWREADNRAAKIVSGAGITVLGIFLMFIIVASVTTGGQPSLEQIIAYVISDRPEFAADAFFEWLVLLSVITWTLMAALEAMTRNRMQPAVS